MGGRDSFDRRCPKEKERTTMSKLSAEAPTFSYFQDVALIQVPSPTRVQWEKARRKIPFGFEAIFWAGIR